MNKRRNKYIKWLAAAANVVVIVYVLGVAGVVATVNPVRPVVSEIEKRELAKAPEFSLKALANGSYTKELSMFFADTFPMRDVLIKAGSEIKENMGFRVDNVKIYGGAADNNTNETVEPVLPPSLPLPMISSEESVSVSQQLPPEESSKPEESSEAVHPSSEPSSSDLPVESSGSNPAVSEEPDDGNVTRAGSILTIKGIGYTLFGGGDSMGEWYAQVINAYGDMLKDKIKVYNLVVPTSVEFNLPERYRSMSNSQRASLDNIKSKLNDNVHWVDIYDVIKEHKDEYLFFRTDHHWTSLGAYYAYTEFAKVAGFEPISLEGLESRRLEDFLGTLYSQTQDSRMINNKDYVEYFILPEMPKSYMYKVNNPDTPLRTSLYGEYAKSYNSYSVFMHGDCPMFVMESDLNNGRRIAVVKESYGNAFVPFLAANYEKVVVIDQRYLQKGFYDVLEQQGINELLFINNILAAHTPVRIRELTTLPSRSYAPQVVEQPASSQPASSSESRSSESQ